jgi:hypothetical protein
VSIGDQVLDLAALAACRHEAVDAGLATTATGERRAFLEDGDTVILRGGCEREGAVRIGFGECHGTVWSVRSAD